MNINGEEKRRKKKIRVNVGSGLGLDPGQNLGRITMA